MSSRPRGSTAERKSFAYVFAALGDETRLELVGKLSDGSSRSIAELTSGSGLTRQAVTKHLKILERAGIVQNIRSGRESLYEFAPGKFQDMKEYLEFVTQQWDSQLARLKNFVEG